MYSSTLPSTSALDGGGWSTPRPGRFTPRERPGIHWNRKQCWIFFFITQWPQNTEQSLSVLVVYKISLDKWENKRVIKIAKTFINSAGFRRSDLGVTATQLNLQLTDLSTNIDSYERVFSETNRITFRFWMAGQTYLELEVMQLSGLLCRAKGCNRDAFVVSLAAFTSSITHVNCHIVCQR
jgi:hypothetical protein